MLTSQFIKKLSISEKFIQNPGHYESTKHADQFQKERDSKFFLIIVPDKYQVAKLMPQTISKVKDEF